MALREQDGGLALDRRRKKAPDLKASLRASLLGRLEGGKRVIEAPSFEVILRRRNRVHDSREELLDVLRIFRRPVSMRSMSASAVKHVPSIGRTDAAAPRR
jgi:hypothetical protein